MRASCFCLLLLSFLLLACAGNPDASANDSPEVVSNTMAGERVEQEQVNWANLGQELWVEDPIFNGKLHLVEAGQQNSQTILLIHGLGYRGMLDWEQVFPELSDTYHVLAIDLPGFGSSDKQQVQYAPQKYARLINWVVSQYAHDSVIVIGHSLGGAVSLRFAHDYPEQVSRLIMVDTAGVLQRTVFIKYLAKVPVTYEWLAPFQKAIPALDRLIRRVASKADGWTQSLLITMDQLPDVPELLMSSGLAQQYLYKDRDTMNAALGLVYEDFSAAAREVEAPTHIIWGEHDRVAPIRTGTVLAALLPNAELHVIRTAGHVPMTDNFDDFMVVLRQSLGNTPHAKQPQRRLAVIEKEMMTARNTRCDGQSNLVYTGRYGIFHMRNCRGVVLRDVVAESIELVGSEVTLENVKLNSLGVGLSATNSVVTATLLQIEANVGLEVENSYLDLAGADFIIRDKLVDIHTESQLYFSLSEYQQGTQKSPLHGVSLGAVLNVR